jgi:hypothetical protein
MPFSAFDLLATIVTALFSSHASRFDRLTVDNACAGLRVPLEADPHTLAQGSVLLSQVPSKRQKRK